MKAKYILWTNQYFLSNLDKVHTKILIHKIILQKYISVFLYDLVYSVLFYFLSVFFIKTINEENAHFPYVACLFYITTWIPWQCCCLRNALNSIGISSQGRLGMFRVAVQFVGSGRST